MLTKLPRGRLERAESDRMLEDAVICCAVPLRVWVSDSCNWSMIVLVVCAFGFNAALPADWLVVCARNKAPIEPFEIESIIEEHRPIRESVDYFIPIAVQELACRARKGKKKQAFPLSSLLNPALRELYHVFDPYG